MPTLAIVGTLVWDRIVPVDGTPVERWGGIGYALAAASVALPADWDIRPVVRVGSDLAAPARELLEEWPRVDADALAVVRELSNRVELTYRDEATRVERLSGGVSGWNADGLRDAIGGCDALLLNFVSGLEADLLVVEDVCAAHDGPRYADLHSLLLGVAQDGTRVDRRLGAWRRWLSCFDAVQMNEVEFGLLGEGSDRVHEIRDLLHAGPRVAAVTRGAGGATLAVRGGQGVPVEVDVPLAEPRTGDPTGCGDVWGATMFARMLAGEDVVGAATAANRAASASVGYCGVDGLFEYLLHEVRP